MSCRVVPVVPEIDLKHGDSLSRRWSEANSMTYFILEPEVAGSFGPATAGDLRATPPLIEKFNYEFDTWLGDPLLEALCTFIVTDRLKDRLIEARASGIAFGDVEV